MRCGYCGSGLHTAANCPKSWGGSARRNAMRCTYCGGRDHTINACPKTAGSSKATDDDRILDPWRR